MTLTATAPPGQPWEQFLDLPDDDRAEYLDGKTVVGPPPSFGHQEVRQRPRDLPKAPLGSAAIVGVGVGWRLPGEPPGCGYQM